MPTDKNCLYPWCQKDSYKGWPEYAETKTKQTESQAEAQELAKMQESQEQRKIT